MRHRSGGVGLRSERPGITGPWGRRRRGTGGPARSRVRLRRRRSVHRLAKTASPRRFGAFVYTVGLLRCCGQARRRRSVHRSAEMTPRSRFGAFVYTVGLWAWVVGGLGITIVYTNGRIGPLRTGLGRLCTLLGRGAVADRRGDAGVYTDWPKWPLGAVLGRLCTLLRHESRYELRRE